MSDRHDKGVFHPQYWRTTVSWSDRYNVELARLNKLDAEVSNAKAAKDQAYRMWRGYPAGSAKAQYYAKQYAKLELRIAELERLVYEQRDHIRKIEDGWIDP